MKGFSNNLFFGFTYRRRSDPCNINAMNIQMILNNIPGNIENCTHIASDNLGVNTIDFLDKVLNILCTNRFCI